MDRRKSGNSRDVTLKGNFYKMHGYSASKLPRPMSKSAFWRDWARAIPKAAVDVVLPTPLGRRPCVVLSIKACNPDSLVFEPSLNRLTS